MPTCETSRQCLPTRTLCAICTRLSIFVPSDRKSTRLNSSHLVISYAVFCLKNKELRRCHLLRRGGPRNEEARPEETGCQAHIRRRRASSRQDDRGTAEVSICKPDCHTAPGR